MEPDFSEAGIDFEKANAARMDDYWLGGGHHFAVDRRPGALGWRCGPDAARSPVDRGALPRDLRHRSREGRARPGRSPIRPAAAVRVVPDVPPAPARRTRAHRADTA
jgi:hypothetical protein